LAEPAKCENCGRPKSDSASGLCPNCLLRSAIEYGAAQTLAPLLPNLRYFGDYELLEEIARGGMGVVYRARQASLDRIVAVKMMRPGLLATEAEIQRFRAEARTAASLQHPNIVAIHEVGEFDGLHYFSMDFVDGPSLAALVHHRPLSGAEAARHVQVLAEAVGYAHGRGILHRDLKPSNVLVDGSGRPRITDFGLARPLDGDSGATLSGAVVGTPAYMPPEQAAGEHQRLSPASDVYSLGALLYELLTGRPPFQGKTQYETVQQVLHETPEVPRKLNAKIDRELEAICLRCLEKDPARRYATAQELSADLGRFLGGEPVQAKARMRARRRLWIEAAIAAGLLAVLAILWHPGPAVPPPAHPATKAPQLLMPFPVYQQPGMVAILKPPAIRIPATKSAPGELVMLLGPHAGVDWKRTFTFRYTGADKRRPIASVQIDFRQGSADGPHDCNIFVDVGSGAVGLQYNPAGGPGLRVTGSAGSLGTLENSVCTVDLSGTAIERPEGATEIRLPITFRSSFAGKSEIHSRAQDSSGKALDVPWGMDTKQ
jgi:hypothetical protein